MDIDGTMLDSNLAHARSWAMALQESGVSAERAVLIGDTPYDVQAAARAGVACIGVRCGGWSTSGLDGAVAVFADVAEILARLDEPPLSDWFPQLRTP